MLMVSKMESGRLQPSLIPFSISNLILEKEPNYRLQAQREEKQFVLNLAEDMPSVTADFDLIGRVIDNLVDNAFKYTETGGEIIIETEQKDGSIEVRVRDDGEGIKEEFKEKIFNKFTQAMDEKGRPLRQGVGLGLTFCRMVVEAHSGRIWVESSPETGSTFFFTLPL
jgi:signal transduction histidine kinase